jgi:hypothetical protein
MEIKRAKVIWILCSVILMLLVLAAGAFVAVGDTPNAILPSPLTKAFSNFPSLISTACACATEIDRGNEPGAERNTHPGVARGTEERWRLAKPITYENLAIFPIVAAQDSDTSGFETLDEALASGDAIVSEQGGAIQRTRDGRAQPSYSGAQVNQLVLVNRGKRPLLLLAGEVVSGGKQDRIIGKDRIVPIGAPPLPLDVFCVEHGRWTSGTDKFAAAKTMVHPSVREKAAVEQDQGQVWAAVSGQSARAGRGGTSSGAMSSGVTEAAPMISSDALSSVIASSAPTQSYRQIYQSRAVGDSVESFAEEIQRRFDREKSGMKGERIVGVVVAYGGEIAWSDAFASSELFESYWPKLLRSYVVEALTRPAFRETASFDDARDFLRPASGHVREESDPGVYRWSERTEGRRTEIALESLRPKPLLLHWLKLTAR